MTDTFIKFSHESKIPNDTIFDLGIELTQSKSKWAKKTFDNYFAVQT